MKKPLWVKEFGSSYDVPAVIVNEPDVEDVSWHNDVCPSFKWKGAPADDPIDLRLWVEHPDFGEREAPYASRFSVSLASDTDGYVVEKIGTDDAEEALQVFREWREIVATWEKLGFTGNQS